MLPTRAGYLKSREGKRGKQPEQAYARNRRSFATGRKVEIMREKQQRQRGRKQPKGEDATEDTAQETKKVETADELSDMPGQCYVCHGDQFFKQCPRQFCQTCGGIALCTGAIDCFSDKLLLRTGTEVSLMSCCFEQVPLVYLMSCPCFCSEQEQIVSRYTSCILFL